MKRAPKTSLAREIDVGEILDRILEKGIVFDDLHRGVTFAGIEILHVDACVKVSYAERLFVERAQAEDRGLFEV